MGALQGWPLGKETRGCPVLATAGASRLCNSPSTATAQPVSEAGGTSGKMSSQGHGGDRGGLDKRTPEVPPDPPPAVGL